MAFVSGGFVIYSYDYLTEKPIYRCEKVPNSGEYVICTSDEICKNKRKFYIDWNSHESLDNWIETLDLMCNSNFEIQYISHAFYFGQIIGSIFIARIPDVYGRKWPF
jgi:hypothetical protein